MTISLFTFVILGTGSLHESLTAIIIARSLTGIAVGFSMPAAQIYVSLKSTSVKKATNRTQFVASTAILEMNFLIRSGCIHIVKSLRCSSQALN